MNCRVFAVVVLLCAPHIVAQDTTSSAGKKEGPIKPDKERHYVRRYEIEPPEIPQQFENDPKIKESLVRRQAAGEALRETRGKMEWLPVYKGPGDKPPVLNSPEGREYSRRQREYERLSRLFDTFATQIESENRFIRKRIEELRATTR